MDRRDKLVGECKVYLQEAYVRLCQKVQQSPMVGDGNFGYGNHIADDGSDVSDQMMNLALRQNEEHLLWEIEEALRRVELGIYGICEACGQEIRLARLRVLPYARFCIKCQDHYERGVLKTSENFSKWMRSPDKAIRARSAAVLMDQPA